MMIMWFKDNAKWAVIFFAVLIIGGLILMDRTGSIGNLARESDVAVIDGEAIQAETFQRDLQNYIRSEEARSGKAPEGAQLAQMREGLLNYKIQSYLIEKLFERYHLVASVEEMQQYLRHNPAQLGGAIQQYEGPQALPAFLRDSILDTTRYLAWLSQDSIYDRPAVRYFEVQMKTGIIPQEQLQALLTGQIHRTTAEEMYAASIREQSARLKFYQVPFDSFNVSLDAFKDEDLRKTFEAHPDSFWFHDEAARLAYVRIPIRPSRHDTELMVDFAKELKQRALGGEKFEELAKAYSNDPGSAEQGGSLGGFQPKSSWVPAFGEAAMKLDSGAISDPVLTEYGVHILLSHGKKMGDSLPIANISHILLKITAGTETIDSLNNLAVQIRDSAAALGSLEKSANHFKFNWAKTPIFEKGNLMPLGGAYVPGLNSFAFNPYEKKERLSDPLQSDEGIYVFERGEQFDQGRDFNRAKESIQALLVKEQKIEKARKALESQIAAIKAQSDSSLAPHFGKANLDSSAFVSADNWVPGFGYASPSLFATFQQKNGEWGPVRISDQAALMAKVVERKQPTTTEILQKAQLALQSSDSYLVSALFQEFVGNLPKSANVKNKLDQVYRN